MSKEVHFNETEHSKQSLRVWLRLVACSRIIEAKVRRNFESQFSTTLPRFDVLAILDHAHQTGEESLTMGELSKRLLVSNGNVTGIVNRLAKENYVKKAKHASDARSHVVHLTPEGRKHFVELAHAHEQWVDEMLTDLNEDEMKSLVPTLGKLKTSLNQLGHEGTTT